MNLFALILGNVQTYNVGESEVLLLINIQKQVK